MSNDDDYWDKIAETWEKTIHSKRNPHYHYYYTIDVLVTELLRKKDVQKALEVGCGTAECSINVLKKLKDKFLHIKGVDISQRMIEIGKTNIQKANLSNKITLEIGDVVHLSYPENEFDVIFSRGAVLSYTEYPLQVLHNLHRMLRDGGVIGLDVIAKPQKSRETYVGKIKKSDHVGLPSIIYQEFFTKKNIQIARMYLVKCDTPLYSELQILSQELPSHLPGILKPPSHLNEAKIISDRINILYDVASIQEAITNAGFQGVSVYGTGYANYLRNNRELFEFSCSHRNKISQIEILLQQQGILKPDFAPMLFIIGKKVS